MKTTEPTASHNSKEAFNHFSGEQINHEPFAEIEDNRTESVTQRKLQHMADKSFPSGNHLFTSQMKAGVTDNEIPGQAAVLQRRLSIKDPIEGNTIVNVKRVSTEKLVFILKDNQQAELVVKAEGKLEAGGDATMADMESRFRVGHFAAKNVLKLPNTPGMKIINQNDRDELARQLPNLGQDSDELKAILIQQDHIAYKAEKADVGDTLMEKGGFVRATGTPTNRGGFRNVEKTVTDNTFLRNKAIWSTWGKTAALDLVTDNVDRFPFDTPPLTAAPNFENLDFTASDMPIAFDNLNVRASMTQDSWMCQDAYQNAQAYCNSFVKNISWRWGFLDPATEGFIDQDAAKFDEYFWDGFKEGVKKLRKSKEKYKYSLGKEQKANNMPLVTAITEFLRRIALLT